MGVQTEKKPMITIQYLFTSLLRLPLRRSRAVVVTTWKVGQPPRASH